jgi:hypothetical protein
MNSIPDTLPAQQWHYRDTPDNAGVPDILLPKRTGMRLFRDRNRWYYAGQVNGATPTTLAPTTNKFYAVPYVSVQGGWIDQIAFGITGAGSANSHARVGIYTNKSDVEPMPERLIFDAGEFAGNATGAKATACHIYLEPGQLYWFTMLADGTTRPTCRALGVGCLYPIIGSIGSSNTFCMYHGTQTYGALPTFFPAVTEGTETVPAIAVHFADEGPQIGGWTMLRSYEYYKLNKATRFHMGGQQNSANLGNLNFSANFLYAAPFCYPRGGKVRQLATIYLTGHSGRVTRLGIYSNRARNFPYPHQLQYDSGDISVTSGGTKAVSPPDFFLEPDQLYWLTLLSDATTASSLRLENNNQHNLLGFGGKPTNSVHACGYGGAFTYGPLPSTFPNTHSFSNNSVLPAIGVSLKE